MKNAQSCSRRLLFAVGLSVLSSAAWADTAYWCGLESSATWLSDLAWSTSETPASEAELKTFQDGDDVVFGAIDDATKTVSVDSAVTVGSMAFRSDGNTVSGTGAISFLDGEINVSAGTTNTISAPLAGTVPYVKTGAGVLILAGDNKNLKPTRPLVVREGLLKLTKQQPYSIGCYGASAAEALPITVESGATLDLNGAYWDVNPYYVNATIAGTGYDGNGALIDKGMTAYNKYLYQVTLADDATARSDGQMYILRIVANGHKFTKVGGTQMCVSSFVGAGDLCVKQNNYTVFGTGSLPGSGTTYLSGGALTFWNGNSTYSRPIVVDESSSMQITGGGNALYRMTWTGPIEVKAGKSLSLTGAYNLYTWNLQTDPTGTGTLRFASLTNTITASALTFPGTIQNDAGKILNASTLGTAGWLRNEGQLVPMGAEMTFSRSICGGGTTYIVASNKVTMANAVFTNGLSVSCGELTLDNVKGQVPYSVYVGQANTSPYAQLTNVTAVLTIKGDSDLYMSCMQTGNGDLSKMGNLWPITGIVNQVSGNLHVTGVAGDDDALHLGHWPMGRSTYNMMGGELTVTNRKYKIAVAVDGRGIFNLSGGDVYTAEFCLNGREGNNGHGTLNMTGGTLHLGERGLTVGKNCTTYVANLGGGTIKGWESGTLVDVNAALTGTGDAAVTFDTTDGDIVIQRSLTGAGDFNKTGSGVLLITNACTYAGVGRIRGGIARFDGNGSVTGTVAAVSAGVVDLNGQTMVKGTFAGTGVISNGVIGAGATLEGGLAGVGTNTVRGVTFAEGGAIGVTVTAEGCGVVDFESATTLDGVKVVVANPSALDPHRKYVFARSAAGLTVNLDQSALPDGWHVAKKGNTLVLDGNNGTLLIFR